MPPELTTIAGTLAAALVAGLLSFWAGRGLKTHEWKLSLAKEEAAAKKKLYAEFLAEAQRLIIRATEEKVHQASELDRINNQYAEITLVGGKAVSEAAMQVFDSVLLAHVQSDQTATEAMQFHPRKQAFLEAARHELQSHREA